MDRFIAIVGIRNAYKVSVIKSGGRRPFGKPGHR
jgi:hypothetical protein